MFKLFGHKQKEPEKHKQETSTKYVIADVDTTETCGFCFSDVYMRLSSNYDTSTGEVSSSQEMVLTTGENYVHVLSSLTCLGNLLRSVSPDFPDLIDDYMAIIRPYDPNIRPSDQVNIPMLHVQEPTKSGNPRKCPVLLTLLAAPAFIGQQSENMLVVSAGYLPSGDLGSGKITITEDGVRYSATFNTSDDGLYIKQIEKGNSSSERMTPIYRCA